jgi:hypothetical protein
MQLHRCVSYLIDNVYQGRMTHSLSDCLRNEWLGFVSDKGQEVSHHDFYVQASSKT